MSLGRQPPPNPSPGLRKRPPIRSSCASAVARSDTSAPVTSQISAIALMNEILVARNELAATLTSSDVARSVTTTGTPASSTGRNASRRVFSARADADPEDHPGRTEGVLDRVPLAQELRVPRQLGARHPRAPGPGAAGSAARRCRPGRWTCRRPGMAGSGTAPGRSPRASTWLRSAPFEPGSCGVPVQTKWTSPNPAASARSVVNRSRPESRALRKQLGKAGLVERHPAGRQRVDLRPVAVEGQHLVPEDGHADAREWHRDSPCRAR